MTTKKEIAEQISKLLGAKLDSLERMNKEDLVQLRNILKNPTRLVQVAIRSKEPVVRDIEELLENPLKGLQLLMKMGEQIDRE